MFADYPVHTEFSDDSVYPMEQAVRDAIARGMDETDRRLTAGWRAVFVQGEYAICGKETERFLLAFMPAVP